MSNSVDQQREPSIDAWLKTVEVFLAIANPPVDDSAQERFQADEDTVIDLYNRVDMISEGEEECLIVFGNVFTAVHEGLQQRHPERRRSAVQSFKQPSIPNVARDEPEWLFSVPPWLQTIENSMAETLERFESTFTFLPRSEASRSDRHRPV